MNISSAAAPKRHSIDIIFVLLLLGMFALSGITLIVLGTQIYQNILTGMERNSDARTARAYITQKLRQGQRASAIRIGSLDDIPTLEITQQFNGTDYVTKLYATDGKLKELFETMDAELPASAGSDVTAVDALTFDELPGGIAVHLVTATGKTQDFFVYTLE